MLLQVLQSEMALLFVLTMIRPFQQCMINDSSSDNRAKVRRIFFMKQIEFELAFISLIESIKNLIMICY
jgi:hypothetical protein